MKDAKLYVEAMVQFGRVSQSVLKYDFFIGYFMAKGLCPADARSVYYYPYTIDELKVANMRIVGEEYVKALESVEWPDHG